MKTKEELKKEKMVKDFADILTQRIYTKYELMDALKSWGEEYAQEAQKSLIESVLSEIPKDANESDGWDVFFKGEERCCPGDDIAHAINQERQRIRSLLQVKLKEL